MEYAVRCASGLGTTIAFVLTVAPHTIAAGPPNGYIYFESLKLFAMYWLWYILIGLAAGYVASLIVKGSGSGMLLNLVIGMVGGGIGRMAFQTDGHRQHEHAGQPAHLRFRSDSPAVDSRAFHSQETGVNPSHSCNPSLVCGDGIFV